MAVYGTPTMFIDMLKLQRAKRFDLSSLETGLIGAASGQLELVKAIKEELHMPKLVTAYGLTEASPIITMTFEDDDAERVALTGGFPIGNIEIKVVEPENGRILPIGEQGELWFRGYNVFKGYWGQPAKTREAITEDGWMKTGDLAIMTQDAYFKIIGRSKEMINRGGENVFPKEIEAELFKLEAIEDVHVCGVPDDRLGEDICAWIKLKPEASLTEDDVRSSLKGKIANFKIPKYVIFVHEFPMTATGKVQKFKMAQQSRTILQTRND